MALKLVHEATDRVIEPGATCVTFRNEEVTLGSFTARRVYCTDSRGRSHEWFPSVIGCDVWDVGEEGGT